MEIRYLAPSDDRREISRIYEESWKAAYRGIVPQDYLDGIQEGRWAQRLDIPGWSVMVCTEKGEYIGTSSFCRSRYEQYPDAGEVISIYLKPAYWGKGYGRKLLKAVTDELESRGFGHWGERRCIPHCTVLTGRKFLSSFSDRSISPES